MLEKRLENTCRLGQKWIPKFHVIFNMFLNSFCVGNESKMGPKGVQMATWSNISDGARKKRVRVRCGLCAGPHFGNQMGAKWEPNAVKTAIKNASKFDVDLEMHFWRKRWQNGAKIGAKTEPKWSLSHFQKRRERKKEKMWKSHWGLDGSTIFRVGPARQSDDLGAKCY